MPNGSGTEKRIVLLVLLALVILVAVATAIAFLNGGIEFADFQAGEAGLVGLVIGLLVKLPAAETETDPPAVKVEQMDVEAETATVTEGPPS